MSYRIYSPQHPLWMVGFRPFFILAMIMGIALPITWALVFSGTISLPQGINSLQWHAHEMLFAFGGATLFGFLLTASKNWVNVRGVHGRSLMILSGLWVCERFFIYFATEPSPLTKFFGLNLFILACSGSIAYTLIKYRKRDGFNDNYFFIILLALIVLSKNLLLNTETSQHGIAMTVGLFRLAFALMFERTMTQFVKNTEGLSLYRNHFLDQTIKILILLCIFQSFIPTFLSVPLLAIVTLLLFIRWIIWRPQIGLRKFGNATMYIGYLGMTLHFAFETLKTAGFWQFGTFSLHIFTFLCMGVVIPSMFIRICQGHTGRKPAFMKTDKIAIGLMLMAALCRLFLPLILPAYYSHWILCAGVLWSVTFLIIGIRLIPFLLQPRVDGKTH